MVAFGDPRLPAPVSGSCSDGTTGRWVDAQNFVIDLPAPLAGGRRCAYDLNPGLRDAKGAMVGGQKHFAFDTGGANIRMATPDNGNSNIEEDEVFLLALNAVPASVAARAACIIDGVGEAVPLDLLPGTAHATTIAGSKENYGVQRLLSAADALAPEAGSGEAVTAKGAVIAVRCRRALPPGGRVAVV